MIILIRHVAVSNCSLLKIKVRMVWSRHKLFTVCVQFQNIFSRVLFSLYFHLDIPHFYAMQTLHWKSILLLISSLDKWYGEFDTQFAFPSITN